MMRSLVVLLPALFAAQSLQAQTPAAAAPRDTSRVASTATKSPATPATQTVVKPSSVRSSADQPAKPATRPGSASAAARAAARAAASRPAATTPAVSTPAASSTPPATPAVAKPAVAKPAAAKPAAANAAAPKPDSLAAARTAAPARTTQPATRTAAPAGRPDSAANSVSISERGSRGEVTFAREVFTYDRSGRRDPFLSLLASGDLRPMLNDLKLVAVAYDPTGRNSVAILRDVSSKDQYRVKLGQTLGRMRVAQIQPRSVTFTIEEFGYSRQEQVSLGDSTTARTQ
jgi:hypothetical protein